jgi:riboflavin synthase
MFTGLIETVGVVERVTRDQSGLAILIRSTFDDLAPGESVAVDGACLSVTERDPGSFRVHVVRTSLDRTCFQAYLAGRRVHLERALRLGDRLGGHLVQGHVDGVGTVERIHQRDDARLIEIRLPPAVADVTIPLGSIAVDGVSLTVNALPAPDIVQVSLIPVTLAHTVLGDRKAGDRVHLEADMLAKWVKQLMRKADGAPSDRRG